MISYMSQITVARSKYRQRNFAATQSSYKVYVSHALSIALKNFQCI